MEGSDGRWSADYVTVGVGYRRCNANDTVSTLRNGQYCNAHKTLIEACEQHLIMCHNENDGSPVAIRCNYDLHWFKAMGW